MAKVNKKLQFKGLDLRTNKLYREDGTASNLANVRLNHSRELVKREDFDQLVVPRGTEGETGSFLDKLPFTTKIIGMIEDYTEDYVILVCYDDLQAQALPSGTNYLYKYFTDNTVEKIESQAQLQLGNNSTIASAPLGYPPLVKNINYKVAEKVLYFTGESVDGSPAYLYKYDGENWHVSGVSYLGNDDNDTGTVYYRVVPFTIDAQARFTFGDYSEGKASSNINLVPDFDRIRQTLEIDRVRSVAGCTINETKTIPWDGSVSDRTIAIDSATTPYVEKGQHLIFVINQISLPSDPAEEGLTYARFLIEDIDRGADTITIGELQSYDGAKWIDASTQTPLDLPLSTGNIVSSKLYLLYTSTSATAGFELRLGGGVLIQSSTPTTIGIPPFLPYTYLDYAGPVGQYFEDFYAEEFLKGVPPKTNGSLAIYRNTLITHDEEFIYLSDNYSGGNQEDFTPDDAYRIGTSDKGPITAVFANETYVVVLRKYEAYYLSGNVLTGNFRDLSYTSTRIGCASAAGVIDIAGVCFFPSMRSIHAALPSGTMKEIGDRIEPLILDNELGYFPNIEDSVSKLDFKREYVYTYIPTSDPVNGEDIILAFSLYHQEWFLYKGIDASGGMYVSDGKVHYSNGTNIFIEATARTKPVEAFYRSNFETLGMASLTKKFVRAKLHTIGMDSASVGFSLYTDYNTEEPVMDEKEVELDEDIFCIKRFPSGKHYSAAIQINSGGIDDLLINGYEYDYEIGQSEYDDKSTSN